MHEQGKYLKHVACLDTQGCGSSDAMAIYIHEDDTIKNGYCYSCHKWFSADEIEKGEKLPIKKARKVYTGESVEDILQYPILALEDRGISKEAAEFFGVRTSFNETTGEAECRYFPYYQNGHLCFKKKSITDKTHQSFIGNISGEPLNFFGQNLTKGTQFIIVVEGEEDCLAAWDILRKAKRNYNVISLPNGASDTPFKQNFQWIYEFTQITLAFDNDKPGQDAAKKVYDLLDPGQVKLVEFKDFKDTNDYLKASADRAWMQAIYNASVKKPDGIVTISDIWEEAIRRPEYGEDWPWPKLTKLTYGRRLGEIYGIGAGTGCGKSEWFKELVNQVIIKCNKPIGCAFLEEPASMSAKRIAGKQSNQKFFIPDAIYDQQDLEENLKKLDNKLWLYDHNGYKDWNAIKAYFKYLNKTKGIEDFILDNLTAIVAQEDSEYTALNSIMEEMASLAESLKCRIYYASHLRKPTGTPHESGGKVQLPEFKGSGAMSNWSHFIFGLERHTQHEDKTIRNTTTFRILKDRYTGLSTGETFELWYDHNTGIYREKTEDDFYSDGKVEF